MGASRTASQFGYRMSSCWKARPELVSEVFWERRVRTSSVTGSLVARHGVSGASLISRLMIAVGRSGLGGRRRRGTMLVPHQHELAVFTDVLAGEEEVEVIGIVAAFFADDWPVDHERLRGVIGAVGPLPASAGAVSEPDQRTCEEEGDDSSFHVVHVIDQELCTST